MSASDESLADVEMLARQGRTKLVVLLAILVGMGAAIWWFALRVTTDPAKVLVAVSVSGEGHQWWTEDRGATGIAAALNPRLVDMGLSPTSELDAEERDLLKTALSDCTDEASLLAVAAKHGFGTVVLGDVTEERRIELEGADFSDFIVTATVEVVDSQSGERVAVPDTPLRVFLWGADLTDSVAFNNTYVADRIAGPLADALARLPRIAAIGALDEGGANNAEKLAKIKLEPLFNRAQNYQEALAAYEKDSAAAAERDDAVAVAPSVTRTGIGEPLGQEFFVGTVADGRALVMADVGFVTVNPKALGYRIDSQSERFELVADDGARTNLFEHYNFFSFPSISADGTTIAAVVANHGASKTLAWISVPEGTFTPLLTHGTEYYSTPSPSADGTKIAFFVRPKRRSPSALAVIDRDGGSVRTLVDAGPRIGVPHWAPDGASMFLTLGDDDGDTRVVRIDVGSGEMSHVIGREPLPSLPPGADIGGSFDGFDEDFDEDAVFEGSYDAEGDSEQEPPPPDPATSSSFDRVALTANGTKLFVGETAHDGTRHLGVVDLQGAAPKYERLTPVQVMRLEAHPSANEVAVEGFVEGGGRDVELFRVDDKGTVTMITNDGADDELGGWSRRGDAVFGLRRQRRSGERGTAVRVFRYGLGG